MIVDISMCGASSMPCENMPRGRDTNFLIIVCGRWLTIVL